MQPAWRMLEGDDVDVAMMIALSTFFGVFRGGRYRSERHTTHNVFPWCDVVDPHKPNRLYNATHSLRSSHDDA